MTDNGLSEAIAADLKERRRLRRKTAKDLREDKVKSTDLAGMFLTPDGELFNKVFQNMIIPPSLLTHSEVNELERHLLTKLRNILISHQTTDFVKKMKFQSQILLRIYAVLGQERYSQLLKICPDFKEGQDYLASCCEEQKKMDQATSKSCQSCHAINPAHKCPCGRARYCSKDCQRADWARHKEAEHKAN